ncbi:MAG: NAD+ kinase [Gammaproteobacteria bacterium]
MLYMSEGFNTVGVIAKGAHRLQTEEERQRVAATVLSLIECLIEFKRTVLIDEVNARQYDTGAAKCSSREQLGAKCDLIVVVGGDGTLLDAARSLAPHGVPLLGVNLGRLGFLVDVAPGAIKDTIRSVLAGDFTREDRLMLSASLEQDGQIVETHLALNDVVLHSRGLPRVLEFETRIDGGFITTHRADGLIIATPTGSTAYALSGGGPVLHPSLDAIGVVPICPHTLSDRPIVAPASSKMDITLHPNCINPAIVSWDGQEIADVNPGDTVRISRAHNHLRLIHPRDYDYFDILRTKLHWGQAKTPGRPVDPLA